MLETHYSVSSNEFLIPIIPIRSKMERKLIGLLLGGYMVYKMDCYNEKEDKQYLLYYCKDHIIVEWISLSLEEALSLLVLLILYAISFVFRFSLETREYISGILGDVSVDCVDAKPYYIPFCHLFSVQFPTSYHYYYQYLQIQQFIEAERMRLILYY